MRYSTPQDSMQSKLKTYLTHFPVQHEHIGPLLSKGKQHLVYEYGSSHVLKIPRTSLYNRMYGALSARVVDQDLALLRAYCAEFIPQTRVLTANDQYLLVQEKLQKPAFVTPASAKQVRSQLEALITAGHKLYQDHGVFLDLFGYQGMTQSLLAAAQLNKTRALLTNVLIEYSTKAHARPRLLLVDTNLSSIPQKSHPANLFHRGMDLGTIGITKLLARWAFAIQV